MRASRTRTEIISTDFEIVRLRAWIEINAALAYEHIVHNAALPVGTNAARLCEQLSDARKALVELLISQAK